MAQSISNESVCIRDSETVAVAKNDVYIFTLASAGRLAFYCVAMPGVLIAETVYRVSEGKDLRGILVERIGFEGIEDQVKLVSVFGGAVGLMAGAVSAGASGNIALLPLFGVGGTIAAPYAFLNGFGLLYSALEGLPMAFRAAAKMTVNSRAVKALTTGAPEARAALKGIAHTPLFTLQKPGAK